jgi:hypothetical protein
VRTSGNQLFNQSCKRPIAHKAQRTIPEDAGNVNSWSRSLLFFSDVKPAFSKGTSSRKSTGKQSGISQKSNKALSKGGRWPPLLLLSKRGEEGFFVTLESKMTYALLN